MPTYLELHLTECLTRENVTVPKQAFPYIREAMKDFAAYSVREIRKQERDDMLWVFRNLPRVFLLTRWRIQKLYIRRRFFNMAKKEAIARANTEGYKVYVVRDSDFRYRTFSTLDFKIHKTIRAFKKDLTAKDMERTAAYIAHPPKGSTGSGHAAHDVHEIARSKRKNKGTNIRLKKKRNQAKHRNIQPIANPKNKKPEDETQEKNERQEKE